MANKKVKKYGTEENRTTLIVICLLSPSIIVVVGMQVVISSWM